MSSIFTIPNDFISRSFDDGNTGLADYRDNFMRDARRNVQMNVEKRKTSPIAGELLYA